MPVYVDDIERFGIVVPFQWTLQTVERVWDGKKKQTRFQFSNSEDIQQITTQIGERTSLIVL